MRKRTLNKGTLKYYTFKNIYIYIFGEKKETRTNDIGLI